MSNDDQKAANVARVNANDKVQVDVNDKVGGSYSISIRVNGVLRWSGSGMRSGEPLSSGECVAESPLMVGGAISQLSNFGNVTFTSCVVRQANMDIGQQIPSTSPGGMRVVRADITHDSRLHARANLPSNGTTWSVSWLAP